MKETVNCAKSPEHSQPHPTPHFPTRTFHTTTTLSANKINKEPLIVLTEAATDNKGPDAADLSSG